MDKARPSIPHLPIPSARSAPGDLDTLLDTILEGLRVAARASQVFLGRRAPDGGVEFLGRAGSTDEIPPLVEDAFDRAFREKALLHFEGEEIGVEFGDVDLVRAVLAIPLPVTLGAASDTGVAAAAHGAMGPGSAVLVALAPEPLSTGALDLAIVAAAQATSSITAHHLTKAATRDPATGLLSREFLERALAAAHLSRTAAQGMPPLALAMVFPRPEEQGEVSDAELGRLGAMLAPVAGTAVSIARWPRPGDARLLAALIEGAEVAAVRAVATRWIENCRDIRPISIGFAVWDSDVRGARDLEIRALEALSQAVSGDSGPVVWSPQLAGAGVEAATGSPDLLGASERAALEAREPADLLERGLDILIRASGASRGRIALGRGDGPRVVTIARLPGERPLEPAGEVDEEAARPLFERPRKFWLARISAESRKRRPRGKPEVSLYLPLEGRGAVLGLVELEFDTGDPAPEDPYVVAGLVLPIGLAAANFAAAGRLAIPEGKLARPTTKGSASRGRASLKHDYTEIIGDSPAMIEMFQLLDKVVASQVPVLVLGESGTGKELIARALHHKGPRRSKPFVSENCAAVTETLLESELFGYVKGAFTGAAGNKRGLFEVADGGTLFLDEVGDMSPGMQKKLLRALQEGEIRPVGAKSVKHVDTRVIAATNKDLQKMVKTGEFREDLYYRLNVVAVHLPPLRDRADDVKLLVDFFFKKTCEELKVGRRLTDEAKELLLAYRWPGNIRELENEVKRIVALSDDEIGKEFLSPGIQQAKGAKSGS